MGISTTAEDGSIWTAASRSARRVLWLQLRDACASRFKRVDVVDVEPIAADCMYVVQATRVGGAFGGKFDLADGTGQGGRYGICQIDELM